MSQSVNIIGAGKLGSIYAHLLNSHGAIVREVCNKTEASSAKACKLLGFAQPVTLEKLSVADLNFICTPDDTIPEVTLGLSKHLPQGKGQIIAHCSGALPSAILEPLQQKGYKTACIHPFRSFIALQDTVQEFVGTYCSLEGDPEAITTLKTLFTDMGAICIPITADKKIIYHMASVFAANYTVTLASIAQECLATVGVAQEFSLPMITSIMKSAIANLERENAPEKALTGPIMRGDIATVQHHMQSSAPSFHKEIYAALGKASVSLTSHNSLLKNQLNEVLDTEALS